MEILLFTLVVILFSMLFLLARGKKNEKELSVVSSKVSGIAALQKDAVYWEKRRIEDSIPVTTMTKPQLDRYIEEKQALAALIRSQQNPPDPEELICVNSEWFDLRDCDVFPSKTLLGDELYLTPTGSWVKRKRKSKEEYQNIEIDNDEAYRFLIDNNYRCKALEVKSGISA